MATPTSASPRPITMTPAKLRAQRANAQLSTGPRTPEGRRRSALNRLDAEVLDLPGGRWLHGGVRDFQRIWRDLVALFWFVNPAWWRERPKLEFYLRRAAWAWWEKLCTTRSGFLSVDEAKNASIESHLSDFLFELRLCNQKYRCRLRKEFGADGRGDFGKLREGIEARLSVFRDLRVNGSQGTRQVQRRDARSR